MLRIDPEPLGGPFDRLSVLSNAEGLAAKQAFALPKGQEMAEQALRLQRCSAGQIGRVGC